jgi:hypothetical protein
MQKKNWVKKLFFPLLGMSSIIISNTYAQSIKHQELVSCLKTPLPEKAAKIIFDKTEVGMFIQQCRRIIYSGQSPVCAPEILSDYEWEKVLPKLGDNLYQRVYRGLLGEGMLEEAAKSKNLENAILAIKASSIVVNELTTEVVEKGIVVGLTVYGGPAGALAAGAIQSYMLTDSIFSYAQLGAELRRSYSEIVFKEKCLKKWASE